MKNKNRKNTIERRKEIVKAVLIILGRNGLKSLSTKTIADEVGLSTGALFRHFRSLEDILSETVLFSIQEIETTFPDSSLDTFEKLELFIRNRVILFKASPGLAWLLRSEQAYSSLSDDSVILLKNITNKSRKYLLAVLKDGVSKGKIREDIDPKYLLLPIMGTIHSIIGFPGIGKISSTLNSKELEKIIKSVIQLISKH